LRNICQHLTSLTAPEQHRAGSTYEQ